MTHYSTPISLIGKTLVYGDTLEITYQDKCYTFLVMNNQLYPTSEPPSPNRTIYDALGIDARQYCSIQFGYSAGPQNAPTCKAGDFKALTNLALSLFYRCEELPAVKVMPQNLINIKKLKIHLALEAALDKAYEGKISSEKTMFTVIEYMRVSDDPSHLNTCINTFIDCKNNILLWGNRILWITELQTLLEKEVEVSKDKK